RATRFSYGDIACEIRESICERVHRGAFSQHAESGLESRLSAALESGCAAASLDIHCCKCGVRRLEGNQPGALARFESAAAGPRSCGFAASLSEFRRHLLQRKWRKFSF